ncbi:hypothetical protein FGIG_10074 [Fasciola gigantica]|uniref:Uncharacterized protein n=1 Tax=Fasciola gigantica TaxID=46835 RepID=A0A504Z6W3_FASGI|nr:hypothetical protein FGIG_10074 [Fasciola gigantica]
MTHWKLQSFIHRKLWLLAMWLIAALNMWFAVAKLPPTPAPCLPQALQLAAQCQNVELSTLIRLLPQDPRAFLFGIFLGQLLQICEAVDHLLQCDSINLTDSCQRPASWTTQPWDTSVRPIIDLCQDPHLYEKYTVVLNCVKANDDRFRLCYQSPPRPNDCNSVEHIRDCVERQWRMFCLSNPSVQLVPYLVNAGLWKQWSLCGKNDLISTESTILATHNQVAQRGRTNRHTRRDSRAPLSRSISSLHFVYLMIISSVIRFLLFS